MVKNITQIHDYIKFFQIPQLLWHKMLNEHFLQFREKCSLILNKMLIFEKVFSIIQVNDNEIGDKMIKREKYIKQIRNFYDSDLIKVLVGIRRCGKSVILQSIMEEIKSKTNNIIYLNFEKTNDLMKASNAVELVEYVNKNRKDGKCYIFLDEVQEVDDWQIAVKDLRLDSKNSIFITGSNSKLLSSEILTLLSGRFVSFRIRPFSYKEILEF